VSNVLVLIGQYRPMWTLTPSYDHLSTAVH